MDGAANRRVICRSPSAKSGRPRILLRGSVSRLSIGRRRRDCGIKRSRATDRISDCRMLVPLFCAGGVAFQWAAREGKG